ncbi:hypothetical protein IMZ48_24825 [Candidatus Bathyarchaeota archaeon]|nr:hypothetical protein [Candidatus Bathyarchaeota archaeon]
MSASGANKTREEHAAKTETKKLAFSPSRAHDDGGTGAALPWPICAIYRSMKPSGKQLRWTGGTQATGGS